jgi:hypothetical protein
LQHGEVLGVRVAVAGQVRECELTYQLAAGKRRGVADRYQRGAGSIGAEQVLILVSCEQIPHERAAALRQARQPPILSAKPHDRAAGQDS